MSSAFGAAALFDDPRYEFQHGRNLLREVWEGPDQPSLFPVSVWRFLNRPLRDYPAQRSLHETLIARWRQDGQLGEALLFGHGGSYEIEDPRARASMWICLKPKWIS